MSVESGAGESHGGAPVELVEPRVSERTAGGLKHRILEWGSRREDQPTIVMVHGYLDCAGSFSALASLLSGSFGFHCIAADVRGHGGTEWVGQGGYYHFFDYVRDLRDLVTQVGGERPILLGHSMGGGIATLFAGTWPEELSALVLLEGLGPPAEDYGDGPDRMRRWLRELDGVAERPFRSFESLEKVGQRLGRLWPTVPAERLLDVARWQTRREGDHYVWSYDPAHRTRTPMIFRPDRWAPFLQAIRCPVLTITGGQSWYRWPDLEERRANLVDRTHVHIETASHMLHLDSPLGVSSAIYAFIKDKNIKR